MADPIIQSGPETKTVDIFNVLRDTFSKGLDPYLVAEKLAKDNSYNWNLNEDIEFYKKNNPNISPGDVDQLYQYAQGFNKFVAENGEQINYQRKKKEYIQNTPPNLVGPERWGYSTGVTTGKHGDFDAPPSKTNLRPFFSESELATFKGGYLDTDGTWKDRFVSQSARLNDDFLLEWTPEGEPYWKKRAEGEFTYGKTIASTWGDQKKYGYNILLDGVKSLYSGAVPETAQGFLTLGLGLYDILDVSADKAKGKLDNGDAFHDWMSGAIANLEKAKYLPSEELQNQTYFKSFAGTVQKTASGLGYLLPQILVPYGVGAMGGSAALIRSISATIGSTQAYNGVYAGYRDAGIDPRTAAAAGLIAFPAVYLTNYAITAPYLTRGFSKEEGQLLRKYVGETATKYKNVGANLAEDGVKMRINREALVKFYNGLKQTVGKVENTWAGEIVMGSGREAVQETSEEAFYYLTDVLYNKYYSEPGSTAGKGAMDISPEYTWRRFYESFVGAGILGGIGDGINRALRPKGYNQRFERDPIVNVYNEEGYEKGKASLNDFGLKSHTNGDFGSKMHYDDGTVYNPAEVDPNKITTINEDIPGIKDRKIITQNDANYYRFIKQVEGIGLSIKAAGIFDTKQKFAAKAGDLTDVFKAMSDIAVNISELKSEIAGFEQQLSNPEITPEAKASITSEINTRKQTITAQEQNLNAYTTYDETGYSQPMKDAIVSNALKLSGYLYGPLLKTIAQGELEKISIFKKVLQEELNKKETSIKNALDALGLFTEVDLNQYLPSNLGELSEFLSKPKNKAVKNLFTQLANVITQRTSIITNVNALKQINQNDKIVATANALLEKLNNMRDETDRILEEEGGDLNNVKSKLRIKDKGTVTNSDELTEYLKQDTDFINSLNALNVLDPESEYNKNITKEPVITPANSRDYSERYFTSLNDKDATDIISTIKDFLGVTPILDKWNLLYNKRTNSEKDQKEFDNYNATFKNEIVKTQQENAIRFASSDIGQYLTSLPETKFARATHLLNIYSVLDRLDKEIGNKNPSISGITYDQVDKNGNITSLGNAIDPTHIPGIQEKIGDILNGWSEQMADGTKIGVFGLNNLQDLMGRGVLERNAKEELRRRRGLVQKVGMLKRLFTESHYKQADGTFKIYDIKGLIPPEVLQRIEQFPARLAEAQTVIGEGYKITNDEFTQLEKEYYILLSDIHKGIKNKADFLSQVDEKLYHEMLTAKESMGANIFNFTMNPAADSYGLTPEIEELLTSLDFIDIESTITPEGIKKTARRDLLVSYYVKNMYNTAYMISLVDPMSFIVSLDKVKEGMLYVPSYQQMETAMLGFALSFSDKPLPTYRMEPRTKGSIFKRVFNNKGFVVQGLGGSGKSTITTRSLYSTLNQAYNDMYEDVKDRKRSVVIVGIDDENTQNIESQFENLENFEIRNKYTHEDFIKALNSTDLNVDFIIIDEASKFSEITSDEIAKRFSGSDTFLHIILDPTQSIDTVEKIYSTLPMQEFLPRNNVYYESFRTSNPDVFRLFNAVMTGVASQSSNVKDFVFPNNVHYNDTRTDGVKTYDSVNNIFSEWVKDVSEKNDWANRIYIVPNVTMALDVQEKAKKVLSAMGRGDEFVNDRIRNIRFINSANGKYMDTFGQTSIQGKEEDYVYVGFMQGDENIDRRNFNTAVTRGMRFVGIVAPGIKSSETTTVITGDKDEPIYNKIGREAINEWQKIIREKIAAYADGMSVTEKQPVKVVKKQPGGKKKKEEIPNRIYDEKNNLAGTGSYHSIGTYVSRNGDIVDLIGIYKGDYDQLHDIDIVKVIGKGNMEILMSYVVFKANGYTMKTKAEDVSMTEPITENDIDVAEDQTLGRRMAIYKKSAIKYIEGGGNIFHVMIGATEEKNDNSDAAFKKLITERLKDPNGGLKKGVGYNVIFYKDYTLNGTLMHNVILIFDSKGNLMGTFNQPIFGPKDTDKKYDNPDYDYDQIPKWNNKGLNEFTNHLASLYRTKVNATVNITPLGTIFISKITGGSVKLNFPASTRVEQLITKIKDKGGKFLSINGGLTTDINMIKVVQTDDINPESKVLGFKNQYIYATYLDSIDNMVPIEIKMSRLKDTPAVMKSLGEEIRNYRKKLGDKDYPYTEKGINSLLRDYNTGTLSNTIRYNSWMFRGDKLDTSLRGIVEINKNTRRVEVVFPKKDKETSIKVRMERFVDNMERLFHTLNTNGAFVSPVKITTGNETASILKPEYLTPVNDLYHPQVIGRFSQFIDKGTQKISDPMNDAINDIGDDSVTQLEDFSYPEGGDLPFLKPTIVKNPAFTFNKDELIIPYIKKVFGKSFIDGRLEFTPSSYLLGERAYGVVDGFKIILSENDGRGVLIGAEKHEAVEYALKYFISDKSRRVILDSAKQQMRQQEGLGSDISDRDAADFLSEVNRGGKTIEKDYKGITGIINKFLDWFSMVINRFLHISMNNHAINFLDDLNSGKFVDAPVLTTVPGESAFMPSNSITEENVDSLMALRKRGARYTQMQLSEMFNNQTDLRRLQTGIIQQVLSFSPFNRDIDTIYYLDKENGKMVSNFVEALRYNHLHIKTLVDSDTTLGDRVREYSKKFNKYSQFKSKLDEVDQNDRLTIKQKEELKGKLKQAYVYSKLYDHDIYYSVVHDFIPEYDIDSDMIEKVMERLYDDPNLVSHSRSLSGFIQTHLRTLPYFRYTLKNGLISKSIVMESGKQTYVSFADLNSSLIKASEAIRYSLTDNFKSDAHMFYERLLKLAIDGLSDQGNNKQSDIILSMLDQYLPIGEGGGLLVGEPLSVQRSQTIDHTNKYSHLTIVGSINTILSEHFGQKTNEQKIAFLNTLQGQNLKNHQQASSNILLAIASHYLSSQYVSESQTSITYTNDGKIFHNEYRSLTDSDSIYSKLKNRLEGVVYSGDSYNSEVLNQLGFPLTKEELEGVSSPVFFKMNYKEGRGNIVPARKSGPKIKEEQRKFLDFNSNLKTWEFTGDNSDILVQDVSTMLNIFGLMNEHTGRIVNIIFKRGYTISDTTDLMTQEELANMLGTMVSILYNYGGVQETVPYINNYLQKTSSFGLDEVIEGDRPLAEGENKKFSIFIVKDMLQKYADTQSRFVLDRSQDFSYTANNHRRYLYTLGHQLSDMFVNKKGVYASDSFINKMTNKLMREPLERRVKSTIAQVDKNGNIIKFYEPLLSRKMGILKVDNDGGIMQTSRTGIDPNNYTIKDLFDSDINAGFLDSLLSKNKRQALSIGLYRFGDAHKLLKAFTVFDMKNINNHLIKVTYRQKEEGKGKIQAMDLNFKLISDLLNDKFDDFWSKHLRSFEKWNNVQVNIEDKVNRPFFEPQSEVNKYIYSTSKEEYNGRIYRLMERIKQYDPRVLADILLKNGLTENVDFVLVDDPNDTSKILLEPGPSIGSHYSSMMNAHNIFNLDRYFKFKQNLNNPEALVHYIMYMFHDDFLQFKGLLENTGLLHHNEYGTFPIEALGSLEGWELRGNKMAIIKPITDEQGTIKEYDGHKMYKWHPFYAGYFFAHFLLNDSISRTTSTFGQYLDGREQVRRGKSLVAQGYKPTTLTAEDEIPIRTLGTRFNVAHVADLEESSFLLKALGIDHTLVSTDGMKQYLPLHWMFYTEGHGGDMGIIREKESTAKTVNVGYNPINGEGTYNKSATFMFNDDYRQMHPEITDTLTMWMLNGNGKNIIAGLPNLGEMYHNLINSGLSYSEVMSAIKEEIINIRIAYGVDLMAGVISGIESKSTNKFYIDNFNDITLNQLYTNILSNQTDDILLTEHLTEDERVQLNANSKVSYDSKVSDLSQIKFIMGIGGVGNKIRVNEVNYADSILADKNMNRINRRLDERGFSNLLKDLGRESAESRRDINFMMSKYDNSRISGILPGMIGTSFPAFVNMFNEGLMPKSSGIKVVQAPNIFDAFRDVNTEWGMVTMNNQEYKDSMGDLGLTEGSISSRRMSYMKLLDKDGNDIEQLIFQQNPGIVEQLKALKDTNKNLIKELTDLNRTPSKNEKEVQAKEKKIIDIRSKLLVVQSEVRQLIMPWKNMVSKIVPMEVTMPYIVGDLLGIKKDIKPTINQLLTLWIDGKMFNARSFIKSNSADYYVSRKDGIVALEEFLRDNWDKVDMRKSFMTNPDNMEVPITTQEGFMNYLEALLGTMDIFAARIPSTIPSSGFAGEVIMFTHDSGSIMYTNPIKNILDNSDYDIDQLTVLFRKFSREDNFINLNEITERVPTRQSSDDEINNYKFDRIYNTYIDPANIELLLVGIDLENVKNRVTNSKLSNIIHPDSVATFAQGYFASHEGKNMVSYAANVIHVYSVLNHLPEEIRNKLINFQLFESGDKGVSDLMGRMEYVIGTLGTILQIAVDNPKHMAMTIMNIHRASFNLVSAMALSNMSENDIYDFLVSNKTVRRLLYKLLMSTSADQATIQMHETLNDEIKRVENEFKEDVIRRRYDNRKEYLNQKINDLNKKLKEIADKSIPVNVYMGMEDATDMVSYDLENDEPIYNDDPTLWETMKYEEIYARIKDWEGQLKEIGTYEDYEKEYINKKNNLLNVFKRLRMLDDKGEFLSRLMIPFGLNQGIPVHDAEIFNLEHKLKFITLANTIEDITETNISGIGVTEPESKKLSEYGRFIPGYGGLKNILFRNASQTSLDQWGDRLAGSISSLIASDDDLKDTDIMVRGTGESGFGEAIIKGMAKKGYTADLYMPFGKKFHLANGLDGSDLGNRKESSDRFIKQTNIRMNELSYGDDYAQSTWTTVNNSDVVVVFDELGDVTTRTALNRIDKLKKPYIIINTEDLRDSVKLAKKIVGEVKKHTKSIAGIDMVKIGFIGNDLNSLNNSNKTDFENWYDREVRVRGFGNIGAIINSLPNIKQFVQHFGNLMDILDRNLPLYSPLSRQLMRSILDKQKLEWWKYDGQLYNFAEEFNKASVYHIFKGGVFNEDVFRNSLRISKDNGILRLNISDHLNIIDPGQTFQAEHLRLKTTDDVQYFTEEFPFWAKYIMDSSFIKRGIYNNFSVLDGNLIMDTMLSMSPEEKTDYRDQLSQMFNGKGSSTADRQNEKDFVVLLALYDMAKNGFRYSSTGFHDLIPDIFFENYSKLYEDFNRKTHDTGENDMNKKMRLFFPDNALTSNSLLVTSGMRQILKGVTPEYNVQTKKIYYPGTQEAGLPIEKTRFYSVVKWDDQMGDYFEENSLVSRKIWMLPYDASYNTPLEVIRPQDIVAIRQFHNAVMDNKTKLIKFLRYHSYKPSREGDLYSLYKIVGQSKPVYSLSVPRANMSWIYLTNVSESSLRALKEVAVRKPNVIEYSRDLGMGVMLEANKANKIMSLLFDQVPEMSYQEGNIDQKAEIDGLTLTYNPAKITLDTPIHELSHPILWMLRNSDNPTYRAIYDNIMSEVKDDLDSMTEYAMRVQSVYPDKKGINLLHELAATKMGFTSEVRMLEYMNRPNLTMLERVKAIWGNIMTFLRSLILRITNTISTQVSGLNENSTLRDVTNAIMDDFFEGKGKYAIENIIPGQKLDEVLYMLNGVRSDDAVEHSKSLKHINDLHDKLLFDDKAASISQRNDLALINSVLNYVKLSKDHVYKIGVKEIDFSKEVASGNDHLIVQRIRAEVLPIKESFKQGLVENLIGWINEGGASLSSETLQRYFPQGTYHSMYSSADMKELKTYMGIMKDETGNSVLEPTHVYTINQFKSLSGLYPELGNVDFSGLESDNIIIILHQTHKDNWGKRIFDISLYDIAPNPLVFMGDKNNNSILKNFTSDATATKLGVNYKANLIDSHKLMMGLYMMKLISSMPENSINFRTIGVLELNRKMFNMGQKIQKYPISKIEVLNNLKGMRQLDGFMDILPDNLKTMLRNDNFFESEYYEPDYLMMIEKIYRDKLQILESKSFISERYEKQLKTIKDFSLGLSKFNTESQAFHNAVTQLGKAGTAYADLVDALREHQKYLEVRKKYSDDFERIHDVEYKTVSTLLYNLTATIKSNNKQTINLVQTWLNTKYTMHNDIQQNFSRIETDALGYISGMHLNFTDEFNKYLREYISRRYANNPMLKVEGWVTEIVKTLYSRMMMVETLADGTKYRSFRIHFDENDPRTARALFDRVIDKADLELGNFIATKVEELMKGLIKQQIKNDPIYYYDLYESGTLDETLLDKMTEDVYLRNWQKGMLPVLESSSAELFFSGELTKSMGKFTSQTSRGALFQEVVNLNPNGIDRGRVSSLFYNQISGTNDPVMGGSERVKLLGLELGADGQYYLKDKKQNSTLSYDLNATMKYLAMDVYSKQVLEDMVLPALTDAKIVAMTMNLEGVQGNKLVLKWLEEEAIKNIYGMRGIVMKNDPRMDNAINSSIRLILRMTTFSGVAMSAPVMITSLTNNTVETILESIANTIGNPYNMPTAADFSKATMFYWSESDKMNAIARKYQVVETSRSELLNNPKYYPDKNHMWTSNFWHGPNRLTDICYRKTLMIAQMLHDGTWQAHDKEGNYDVTKDARFYKNGKIISPIEQEKVDWLKQDLMKDPRYKQKDHDKPVAAYSVFEERKLQMMSDLFVIGVYNREFSPIGDNMWTVNLVMQFKKFLQAKIETRLSRKGDFIYGSQRTVVTDEMGNLIRSWTPLTREGTWRTTGRLLGELTIGQLANAKSGNAAVDHILEQIGIVFQKRSYQDILKLSPLERHNVARAIMDVSMFLIAYILFSGIGSDDDKEKKKHALQYAWLIRAFKNGMLSTLSTTPTQMLEYATNWAAVTNIRRMFNIVIGVDPLKDISYLAPFGSTFRAVQTYYENQD